MWTGRYFCQYIIAGDETLTKSNVDSESFFMPVFCCKHPRLDIERRTGNGFHVVERTADIHTHQYLDSWILRVDKIGRRILLCYRSVHRPL